MLIRTLARQRVQAVPLASLIGRAAGPVLDLADALLGPPGSGRGVGGLAQRGLDLVKRALDPVLDADDRRKILVSLRLLAVFLEMQGEGAFDTV